MWQRWQMRQSGGVTLHVLHVIQEPIFGLCLSVLAIMFATPTSLIFFFRFFFSRPLCAWRSPGLEAAHSKAAHHRPATHKHSHTLIHAPASPLCDTLRRSGSLSPVCLSVSGPKRTRNHHRITPSSATPPPPTVPTHRSVTAPGERQRANADRKRFDSFVNYIYGFFFFIILSSNISGSSPDWTERMSFAFILFNFLFLLWTDQL